jgi:hypothetical protein
VPNFALRGYSGPMEEIKPEIPDINRADDGALESNTKRISSGPLRRNWSCADAEPARSWKKRDRLVVYLL